MTGMLTIMAVQFSHCQLSPTSLRLYIVGMGLNHHVTVLGFGAAMWQNLTYGYGEAGDSCQEEMQAEYNV